MYLYGKKKKNSASGSCFYLVGVFTMHGNVGTLALEIYYFTLLYFTFILFYCFVVKTAPETNSAIYTNLIGL